jgi:hypothetical protein
MIRYWNKSDPADHTEPIPNQKVLLPTLVPSMLKEESTSGAEDKDLSINHTPYSLTYIGLLQNIVDKIRVSFPILRELNYSSRTQARLLHIEEKMTRTQIFEDVWYFLYSEDEILIFSTLDLFFLQASRDIFEYSGLRMRGECWFD